MVPVPLLTIVKSYLFSQQLSYDGSFQLVRKNKAFDQYDTCLSDGMKYWVDCQGYKDYLTARQDDAYKQSTRVGYSPVQA